MHRYLHTYAIPSVLLIEYGQVKKATKDRKV